MTLNPTHYAAAIELKRAARIKAVKALNQGDPAALIQLKLYEVWSKLTGTN